VSRAAGRRGLTLSEIQCMNVDLELAVQFFTVSRREFVYQSLSLTRVAISEVCT
jgi:hypothetical protein